ncbi:MAG: hypothetical protein GF330_12160 [Candidatus Eisenbacteria bacterium]|nr:hypothetical protein [Candidatus Eisenbacteria bacterium]
MRYLIVLLACAGIVLGLAPRVGADVYTVAPDGSGDFPTIQDAIDAASDGDIVLLEDGVFTGYRNRELSFFGKAISLQSQSDDPQLCIIDAEATLEIPRRVINLDNGEGNGTLIRSITVTGGVAPGG